jgi:hypothetical protein
VSRAYPVPLDRLLPFLETVCWEIESTPKAPKFDGICTLNWIVSKGAATPLKLVLAHKEGDRLSCAGKFALPNESPLDSYSRPDSTLVGKPSWILAGAISSKPLTPSWEDLLSVGLVSSKPVCCSRSPLGPTLAV